MNSVRYVVTSPSRSAGAAAAPYICEHVNRNRAKPRLVGDVLSVVGSDRAGAVEPRPTHYPSGIGVSDNQHIFGSHLVQYGAERVAGFDEHNDGVWLRDLLHVPDGDAARPERVLLSAVFARTSRRCSGRFDHKAIQRFPLLGCLLFIGGLLWHVLYPCKALDRLRRTECRHCQKCDVLKLGGSETFGQSSTSVRMDGTIRVGSDRECEVDKPLSSSIKWPPPGSGQRQGPGRPPNIGVFLRDVLRNWRQGDTRILGEIGRR